MSTFIKEEEGKKVAASKRSCTTCTECIANEKLATILVPLWEILLFQLLRFIFSHSIVQHLRHEIMENCKLKDTLKAPHTLRDKDINCAFITLLYRSYAFLSMYLFS